MDNGFDINDNPTTEYQRLVELMWLLFNEAIIHSDEYYDWIDRLKSTIHQDDIIAIIKELNNMILDKISTGKNYNMSEINKHLKKII